ncbi:hypothetical protein FPZ24_01660 [Sphingomonas panacisoli]|uniref:Uncharacterized protein n=1 Tax=Sphingomonas panacisoli TaxID=1813879 RepID=A0A5B8LF11_9SPHN|nr:hypothetical protein [Sphingomonas panacisoli]QDZ06335.1 hypothetical protein FPZ24_01660 [Sphingomonas panacisoli]
MKSAVICTIAALLLPGAGSAQLRRQPSPLPPPVAPPTTAYGRGGGDMRAQDEWDRALRHCLNDRRQNKRERRACADRGMPTRR